MLSFRSGSILHQYQTRTVFTHQYQTQSYRGRALLQGRQYFASISNVVIQRTCSPLGRTVFTHQYQTQLYRGRALLQGRQYLYINIGRSYIEDVLSFRADRILHQYQAQLYRGHALLYGRQYLYINIKGSHIEGVLSFSADSIYTSISNVVIQRTCSPLGQTVFIHQYCTQLYRGRALLQGREYFASLSNVVIQRTCSPLGGQYLYINIKGSYIEDMLSFRSDSILDQYQTRTVFIHQYQTQLYRGRSLRQGGPYLHINIKRSYIEDVLSFRADNINTSILDVVIQRTCSPLGQTVLIYQYETQLYRGRALLQGRQYFGSISNEDSIYTSISNVVIQRTCSPLGQTVSIHQYKRSYIEDVLSFRPDSIYTSIVDVVIYRTCSPLGQALFCINIKRSYIEDVLSFRADSIYTSL